MPGLEVGITPGGLLKGALDRRVMRHKTHYRVSTHQPALQHMSKSQAKTTPHSQVRGKNQALEP